MTFHCERLRTVRLEAGGYIAIMLAARVKPVLERRAVRILLQGSRALQQHECVGIGRVHRIPPVRLKCVSERRREEMAALLKEQGSRVPVCLFLPPS